MEEQTPREKSVAEMLSKILLEVADGNAHLARLEGRDADEVVDEVSALLRARRRAAIQDIEEWGMGTRTPIE
jgi:hypothetical protein